MVDIKREDITLQDWTKGISADEFAGGSYYFSDGISSGYNTKGFELGPRYAKSELNSRENGYAVALAPTKDYDLVAFTKDGMIETEYEHNGAGTEDGDANGGGALVSMYGTGKEYKNGLAWGTKLIGIENQYINVYDTSDLYTPADELLTEPKFDNGGAGWTLGTGWTITSNGAEHTTGETGTLSATINFGTPPTNNDYVRVAIRIKNCTAGHLTLALNDPSTDYDTANKENGWIVFSFKCKTTSTSLIITPTSTFNGIVEIVNVHLYGSGFNYHKQSLAGSTYNSPYYPAVIWEGDLYVAAGPYVNTISLIDRGKQYTKLVDDKYRIVSMTQQAGNLIIWATDGFDSKQYYWNGVDKVATEVIEWKGLIIKGVTGTETISYVLTASGSTSGSVEGYEFRLYAVSGYQRSLIASKLYQYMSYNYLEEEPYNLNKKFEFNDVETDQAMVMYLDSLFIPGCDGVYKYGYDVPGMRTNRTRPIKYDTGAKHIVMGQRNDFLNIAYRLDDKNYVGLINNRLYNNKGYLVTESIYWDKLSTRKALQNMKIGYKSLASTVGNIKLYAIVDDDYFWRFRPSATPTTRPTVGAVYNVAHDTKAEVIDVDKVNGIITFRTTENKGSYIGTANTTLTKVSGTGDDSIAVGYKFDNMVWLKTIETAQQEYNSDLIFGKDFVNNYMPYWHKIQFVVELNSNNQYLSPEVYEISMVSDITDTVL